MSKLKSIFFFMLFPLLSSLLAQDQMSHISKEYIVPVEDPILEKYASFDHFEVKLDLIKDEFTFKLPAHINHPTTFPPTFKKDNQTGHYISDFGRAVCKDGHFSNSNCEIFYNKEYRAYIKARTPSTIKYLESLKLPKNELAARIAVARSFGNDPIGFLHLSTK